MATGVYCHHVKHIYTMKLCAAAWFHSLKEKVIIILPLIRGLRFVLFALLNPFEIRNGFEYFRIELKSINDAVRFFHSFIDS